MKKFTLLSCFFIILFVSCSSGTGEWTGSIESENGITIVRNPDVPLYGEVLFELEENLSIGSQQDSDYLFHGAVDIGIDGEGCIYVVDMRNSRIQKYDAAGKYLLTIGKKGQGPGEFASYPRGLFLDDDNTLYIQEYRKMSLFKMSGEFIASHPINTNIRTFAVDSNKSILSGADIVSRDPGLSAIVKIDSSGNISTKIAEYKTTGTKIIVGKGLTYTISNRHSYSPRLVFEDMGVDQYLYGYSSEYALFEIDKHGSLTKRIYKDTNPQVITSAEKNLIIDRAIQALKRNNLTVPRQKVLSSMTFEKTRAFFDKILSDDAGRIYVRRIPSVLDNESKSEWEIFGKDGIYLYKATFPFSPELIQQGFMYDIHNSEETGETSIKRYSIKNWNTLETDGNLKSHY